VSRRSLEPAEKGAAAGAGVGMPLATVLVWVIDTYLLPTPMPGFVATAVGSVITGAVALAAQRRSR
jgi:hypothetical protein